MVSAAMIARTLVLGVLVAVANCNGLRGAAFGDEQRTLQERQQAPGSQQQQQSPPATGLESRCGDEVMKTESALSRGVTKTESVSCADIQDLIDGTFPQCNVTKTSESVSCADIQDLIDGTFPQCDVGNLAFSALYSCVLGALGSSAGLGCSGAQVQVQGEEDFSAQHDWTQIVQATSNLLTAIAAALQQFAQALQQGLRNP
ncbi:hypothetical protein JKP88DRAFT_274880 [Tribonema minus]|uniref:Uncharacterized protein n=1 Tax=Tribonema minus TaxID=303371 RepID=A0A835ZDX1_9STRA|nr:hypothetical protein JKP88DRAFT_274880 [Tribonema minus]